MLIQSLAGDRRLILNALGTDVTQELLGEDMSVGHAMSFSPHIHTEVCSTLGVLYLWCYYFVRVAAGAMSPDSAVRCIDDGVD